MFFAVGAMTLVAAPSVAQEATASPAVAVASPGWTPAQVREAQQALIVARYDGAYYRGTVDGLMGRQTAEAIREYQRMHQLPMTGQMSDGLLAHLKTNGSTAAAGPGTPQPAAPVAARPSERTTPAANQRTPTAAPDTVMPAGQPRTTAAATPAQQPRATPAATPRATPAATGTTAGAATPAQQQSAMTRADIIAAQEGLARAELYEGTPSGMMDAPTVAAIRAFQTANEMTVDGELTTALLDHLKMVK
jgi:peptidoglycan hydrolase-like protein with peptidoglycan-binding domain